MLNNACLNGGKFEIFKDINRLTLIFKSVILPFRIFIADHGQQISKANFLVLI